MTDPQPLGEGGGAAIPSLNLEEARRAFLNRCTERQLTCAHQRLPSTSVARCLSCVADQALADLSVAQRADRLFCDVHRPSRFTPSAFDDCPCCVAVRVDDERQALESKYDELLAEHQALERMKEHLSGIAHELRDRAEAAEARADAAEARVVALHATATGFVANCEEAARSADRARAKGDPWDTGETLRDCATEVRALLSVPQDRADAAEAALRTLRLETVAKADGEAGARS